MDTCVIVLQVTLILGKTMLTDYIQPTSMRECSESACRVQLNLTYLFVALRVADCALGFEVRQSLLQVLLLLRYLQLLLLPQRHLLSTPATRAHDVTVAELCVKVDCESFYSQCLFVSRHAVVGETLVEVNSVEEVEFEADVHGDEVHLGEEWAVLDERARQQVLESQERKCQVVETQLAHLLDQDVQIQQRQRLQTQHNIRRHAFYTMEWVVISGN